MSALRVSSIIGACGALVACAQLVGIGDFPGATTDAGDAGDAANDVIAFDAPGSGCDTPIMTLSTANRIDVSSGFVFVQGDNYIGRCNVAGSCTTDPPNFLTLASGVNFINAAVGSSITYTLDDTSGGSVHSMALDGTGDTTLLTTAAQPAQIAVSGANTFWVDYATPNLAAVHCIGCTGPGVDAPWITNLDKPLALFADSHSVYALSYDSTGTSFGIYGCDAQACASAPTAVIEGLTEATAATVASDGTAVYVARPSEVVGVHPIKGIVLVVDVETSAFAVDSTTHEIAYATTSHEIDIAPTDGTLTHRTLATCAGLITWLALDATNVYVLIQEATTWNVYAIKR